MILVSVVIPTRGRPALLLRALRSVFAQTLSDLEAVVVIDGPDPETIALLEDLARTEARLRIVALTSGVIERIPPFGDPSLAPLHEI